MILTLCSADGSAWCGLMTFGWVLCTTEGSRLVKGHGSCPGRPNSLCGEACGMLAATLFTTILKQHLGCTFDSTVLSYQSDNLELIKRQQNHLSYTYPYPNTTLTAEFDLTKMIHTLHRDLTLPSKLCHVKGHQDCHKAYPTLICVRNRTLMPTNLPRHITIVLRHILTNEYYHSPPALPNFPLLGLMLPATTRPSSSKPPLNHAILNISKIGFPGMTQWLTQLNGSLYP